MIWGQVKLHVHGDDFAGALGVDVDAGTKLAIRIDGDDGRFEGVAIAGFSQIKGRQEGWTIGVVNYARELRGVQIGLINIARSNPSGTRVLPIFNKDFSR